jgi:hypothetical protein
MAVPQKGWRPITVDAQRFYWRAIGGDWWIAAVVVTDAAFVHGRTAQQLRFRLDYDQHHLVHPGGGGASLHQRAAISPRVIRRAIELSRKCVPAFSGEFDLADAELPEVDLRELQELARLEPPSFSKSPGLMALDSSDRDLVLACLNAAAAGPFIPEWEFQTLFGMTRDEFGAVVAQWPNLDERDNTTYVAINNALNNLTGYPHRQDALLVELCGADRTEILRVFTLWRDASASSS